MYREIINLLKRRNITLEKGLSDYEIKDVEKIYGVKFPLSYSILLKEVLPVSEGFYNWRDFSEENINLIKLMIKLPFENIEKYITDVEWCEDWGEEPSQDERSNEIRRRLQFATPLIPIFSHRYMPMIELDNPPVVSIHGVDIIYYGKDIKEYFDCEFGEYRKIGSLNEYNYIPFWSDIM